MEMMSSKTAAELWGLSARRVSLLCQEGRIEGAVKQGRNWKIPVHTQKPADQRLQNHAAKRSSQTASAKKLPLPVGISDYCKASAEYYYVDKTLLIRDFLDERPQVSLFTRPRRFGKTLNMDMLRVFFEKSSQDTSIYFKEKKIWACGDSYRQYQGKYPVIFLTFKDVKFETWEETLKNITTILQEEFDRHQELLTSDLCSDYDKEYFRRILSGSADNVDLAAALRRLSKMLDQHHGIAPIIIIDEYDTPIQQGYSRDYYDEIILFMRNLFSGGLKDNRHLSYGFLTGILRVAKESIFSGLNNIKINSILDNRYSEYFGFTKEEVITMAAYYEKTERFEEICSWYDGYRFGETDIFNPWSVISYFNAGCRPQAFWQSTGSNDIIGEILADATPEIMQRLQSLVQNDSFLTHIDTGVIYPQIQRNPSSIYSFLLVAGYLKAVRYDPQFDGDYMCEVALPNREISFVYRKEILSRLEPMFPQSTTIAIQEALYLGDLSTLEKQLQTLLLQSISYYDTANESFYHGLILGLCAVLDTRYYITSNRESGTGRFDIQLMPRDHQLPGILIELKAEKNCDETELEILAQKALEQIKNQIYDSEFTAHQIPRVIKYGVAFCGKMVKIAVHS